MRKTTKMMWLALLMIQLVIPVIVGGICGGVCQVVYGNALAFTNSQWFVFYLMIVKYATYGLVGGQIANLTFGKKRWP